MRLYGQNSRQNSGKKRLIRLEVLLADQCSFTQVATTMAVLSLPSAPDILQSLVSRLSMAAELQIR